MNTDSCVQITVQNFEERLREALEPLRGAVLSTQLMAKAYSIAHEHCIAVLHTMDWVPGDIADFWDIDVSEDGDKLSVDVVPKILKGLDVKYETDSSTPGVTACYKHYEVTAGSMIGANIALARVLGIAQQFSQTLDEEEPRVASDIPSGQTPAESADDKFLLAWDSMAAVMYYAYGSSVGMKNFQGGPMPQWHELPRRIKAAWCFAAQAAKQYER